jgi:hypothetical protein
MVLICDMCGGTDFVFCANNPYDDKLRLHCTKPGCDGVATEKPKRKRKAKICPTCKQKVKK